MAIFRAWHLCFVLKTTLLTESIASAQALVSMHRLRVRRVAMQDAWGGGRQKI